MLKYDVVIIDSGVNLSDPNDKVNGICIEEKENGLLDYGDDLTDILGHGTVIFTIISKIVDAKNLFVIKIGNCAEELYVSCLTAALKYINENIVCRVINISLGIVCGNGLDGLYNVCREISSKGTAIVSSFVNFGCYSYPAAFDCVIGVDNDNDIINANDFYFVEKSPINVLAKGRLQRIKIQNGQKTFVAGSSIACAHMSAFICKAPLAKLNYTDVLLYIKKFATRIFEVYENRNETKNCFFKICNAAVFPFSKEEHAFLRFAHMLDFKISGYYDIRHSGKVGRKLNDYYENASASEFIKDIETIDISNIDTIILGHLDEINSLLHIDYRKKIIDIAIKNSLNIVSFDPLCEYKDVLEYSTIKYYYPIITSQDVPRNSFGKLYKIDRPVVGIFGTSSRQGKFSLQLELKKALESYGYNVGTLGTEPHSLLFGFDYVFPMGYNSSVYVDNHDIVLFLNDAINKMCRDNKEIILISSQAQTIPYYCNNLSEYPSMQYHFALATKPDAIIMCVNLYDEMQYIRNSIYALIGLTDAALVALVVFPYSYKGDSGFEKKTKINQEEFRTKAEQLNNEFHVPILLLGDRQHMQKLCDIVIDFF